MSSLLQVSRKGGSFSENVAHYCKMNHPLRLAGKGTLALRMLVNSRKPGSLSVKECSFCGFWEEPVHIRERRFIFEPGGSCLEHEPPFSRSWRTSAKGVLAFGKRQSMIAKGVLFGKMNRRSRTKQTWSILCFYSEKRGRQNMLILARI